MSEHDPSEEALPEELRELLDGARGHGPTASQASRLFAALPSPAPTPPSPPGGSAPGPAPSLWLAASAALIVSGAAWFALRSEPREPPASAGPMDMPAAPNVVGPPPPADVQGADVQSAPDEASARRRAGNGADEFAAAPPSAVPRSAAPLTAAPAAPSPSASSREASDEAAVDSRPASRARRRPAEGDADDLVAEARAIEEMRRRLRASPRAALASARSHRRRFPRGALTEEADAIHVEALFSLGRQGAATAALDRFTARHPNSVHAHRLRVLVDNASVENAVIEDGTDDALQKK
ncbi:MAG: hypothetical protein AAF938_05595 [Myxococcota bacterium]